MFQKSSSVAIVNGKNHTEPVVPAVGQFLPQLGDRNQSDDIVSN